MLILPDVGAIAAAYYNRLKDKMPNNNINTIKRLFLNMTKREQRQVREWFREMERILEPENKPVKLTDRFGVNIDVELEFKGEPSSGKSLLADYIGRLLIDEGFVVSVNYEEHSMKVSMPTKVHEESGEEL